MDFPMTFVLTVQTCTVRPGHCKNPTTRFCLVHFIRENPPFVIFGLRGRGNIFKLAVTFPAFVTSHPKTAVMQKKYWIVPGIIATTLVASLLALSSPNPKSATAG